MASRNSDGWGRCFQMGVIPGRKTQRQKISLMFRKGAVKLAYSSVVITGIETPSVILGADMARIANMAI